MNTLCIRGVIEEDFHDIYSLNKELGYEYDEQKVKIRIQYILENTKDVIFVAEKNHKAIGYIHGSPYELIYSDSLVNILGLVVKQEHRKLGIGGKLIEKLEIWAKENGFYGIRLVSGADRLNAHKFYETCEYVYRKDQKSFIKVFN